jgi:hypothetical protein
MIVFIYSCRSQWPRGLKYAAPCLLGLWVRIPPGARMFVSRDCCLLWGRGLYVGLITRPEDSYRVWCVWVQSRSSEIRSKRHRKKQSYICISYDLTICPMGFIVDKVVLRQVLSFRFLLSLSFHTSSVLIHSYFSGAIKSWHLAPFLNNILWQL